MLIIALEFMYKQYSYYHLSLSSEWLVKWVKRVVQEEYRCGIRASKCLINIDGA